MHIWKEHQEKLTLFEPTPPLRPAHKVIKFNYPKAFFALTSVWQYIGNYVVTSQCLGSGSFATVNLAIDPARYRQVACKSIRTKRDYDVDQVMKEVRILMTLKHVSDIIVLFIVLVTSSSSPTSTKYMTQKKTKNSCLFYLILSDSTSEFSRKSHISPAVYWRRPFHVYLPHCRDRSSNMRSRG